MIELRPDPGTYILVLKSSRTCSLQIGRCGKLSVEPGWYLYVGSAFGPGGARARVGRHLKKANTQRWHIDYLLAVMDVHEVWLSYDKRRHEASWGHALLTMSAIKIPLPGFGASDSHLQSHLVYCQRQPPLAAFIRCLGGVGYSIEVINNAP